MDVLVTVASSCHHHETVISSLLISLVPCHQFCLCGIKFIVHDTSIETGLTRMDYDSRGNFLRLVDPSLT
jgi:hypothetical protein